MSSAEISDIQQGQVLTRDGIKFTVKEISKTTVHLVNRFGIKIRITKAELRNYDSVTE